MNSAKFFFLKHSELVLYIVCFIGHAVFAPLFQYYGFRTLFLYNLAISFIYGIFVLLYTNTHKKIFVTFASLELLFNSFLVTITTGADFSTSFISICIIPALFFFAFSLQTSQFYYILLSLITTAMTLAIIFIQFAFSQHIATGYIAAVAIYKTFFQIHTLFITITTTFFIIYLCIVAETNIQRTTRKTKWHEQELYQMINNDQLTGLMNRRKISSFISKFSNEKETCGTDYSIAIFDIDNFKSVNDTYGHKAGDCVLKEVSTTAQSLIPNDAYIARWGGEEFIIIFQGCDKGITDVLNLIRTQIAQKKFIWNEFNIFITLTIGLSSSRTGLNSNKIIIDADDKLMYGKQNGKNQICVSKNF